MIKKLLYKAILLLAALPFFFNHEQLKQVSLVYLWFLIVFMAVVPISFIFCREEAVDALKKDGFSKLNSILSLIINLFCVGALAYSGYMITSFTYLLMYSIASILISSTRETHA